MGGAVRYSGITTGITHALWGALWPELYGTRNLGAIKAVASAFMVVGSAIGPGITGLAIDLGVPFSGQSAVMAGACIALVGPASSLVLARMGPAAANRPESPEMPH